MNIEEAKMQFNSILHGLRKPIDPDNQLSDLKPDLTIDELKSLREAALIVDEEWNITEYTCDNCFSRFRCPLVFDTYNEAGDCLMEK